MANKPFPFSVCRECCDTGGTADLTEVNEKIEKIENNIGDIDTALDSIIEIQNTLIGGDSE